MRTTLRVCICFLTIINHISVNAQTYDYDTTLKGGYSISCKVDDSLQYLFLKKGHIIIAELYSTSKGMLFKNLGYVGADFTNYFVLVHSFGSGNPHYIQLFKKATGENILEKNAAWIDADEKMEFVLYCDLDARGQKNKMTLLNIRTGKKQKFSFPAGLFDSPSALYRIHISRLTEKELVIKYDTETGEKTKCIIAE